MPLVTLVRPPTVVPKWAHTTPICPPIGVAYVASAVRAAGYRVAVVDALGEGVLETRAVDGRPGFLTRGLSIEEILRACDRLGIRVTVFYVVGLPEDTQESIEETVAYAKRLNTHVAQFFVYTPFPGTRLYDRVKDDLITTDWEQFDCYSPVTKHPTLTPAEILDLKEWAFVSYYYRPAYLAKFAVRAARDLLN